VTRIHTTLTLLFDTLINLQMKWWPVCQNVCVCVCVSKTKKIFPSNESSTQPADVNENDVFVA